MPSLLTLDWIPTALGDASLGSVLTGQAQAPLASGSALTDAALLRLLTLLRARGLGRLSEANTQLYGERPFLQLPPDFTAGLPDTPVHALNLSQASGRDVTLLSRTFDDAPVALSPAQAARTLLTFQAFAPSRGITRWHPGKDSPHARSVHFHATGQTLQATLDLNAAPGLGDGAPPSWEVAPDWTRWQDADREALSLGNLHGHPWRSVTLRPGTTGQVRWVAQASGVVPTASAETPWPDPHALGEATEGKHREKSGAYDRRRNPASREVMGALVDALQAALNGDPLAPMSMMRARTEGAERVWAVGLITRSGQPVALNVAEASLPWPTLPVADALGALAGVTHGADATARAVQAALKGSGVNAAEIRGGGWPGFYWASVWGALSERLSGTLSRAALDEAVEAAACAAALGSAGDKAALIRHIIACRGAA